MTGVTLLGGRYRLTERLAEGGMGEVWRARDELLDRDVAVKLLRTSLAEDAVVAERFRREARAAASLSHPNMANVFDFVEEDGRPGIVMELVEGETLAQTIAREAPMPPDKIVALLDQVLDALAAAHAAGVVHRDVKPANVIVDGTRKVRVTDFGIARAAGESTLTDTGTVLGSVHYVAPEQLEGSPPAPSHDLYGVGVMLYEMLTARRPFDAETPVATAMSRLTNEPEPPQSVRPAVNAALAAVAVRALARDPAERYANATEMRDALDSASRGGTAPVAASRAGDTIAIPVATTDEPTRAVRPQPAAPSDSSLATPRRLRLLSPLWIALALAILLLAGIGVLASRPTTVRVPQLAGTTVDQARALARTQGFTLDVQYRHDATVRAGVIESVVSPKVGQVVERGSKVVVVASDGPPPCCVVPKVIGKPLEDAVDTIGKAGLRVPSDGVTYRSSDQPAGTVLDQSPKTGTLSPGSPVTLVVSSGPPSERRKGKGHGD